MPDLWEGDLGDASDFALPGDEEVVAGMEAAVESAESAPEAPEAPETGYEEEDSGRQRDERGRFVSQTPQEEAEGAEEGLEAPTQSDLDRYLAKYGGDPEKALASLPEKESMIGRQAQEIGQLRAYLAQMQEMQEQAAYQQQVQASQPSDWDELIDENPAYATQLAYQNGDERNYAKAWQAWNEMNPGAPELWANQYAIGQQLAQMQQFTAQQAQQQYAQRRQEEIGNRVAALSERYPDLTSEAFVDEMARIAPHFPHEMAALASGDPETVERAVESLALKARGLQADTLVAKGQDNARKLAQEEQRAVQEAQLVSSTRTNRERPATVAEAIADSWSEEENRLSDGWNIT